MFQMFESDANIKARIHRGGLSTNLGFRTSYDAFLRVFYKPGL